MTCPAPAAGAALDAVRRPSPASFCDALDWVVLRAGGNSMSLGEMAGALGARGAATLMIVLALPFILPVPTVGLSIPFGLAILLLTMAMMRGRQPWLPAFVRQRRISYPMLCRLVGGGKRLSRPVQKLLRPRCGFMFWPGIAANSGVGIALSALVLCLPLPLPFSNGIPAAAIIVFSAGLMERDGACILVGHVLSAAAWGYVYVCWEVVENVVVRVL